MTSFHPLNSGKLIIQASFSYAMNVAPPDIATHLSRTRAHVTHDEYRENISLHKKKPGCSFLNHLAFSSKMHFAYFFLLSISIFHHPPSNSLSIHQSILFPDILDSFILECIVKPLQ